MHKHIGLVIVILIFIVLFFVPTAADKLFALFFIGLVPFTDYAIPAPVMLGAYAALLIVSIVAIGYQLSTAASSVKRDIKSRERARKKVLHAVAKNHPKVQKTPQKKHYQAATES